jgi:peptide/nickel transport system substrate-binding protein
MIRELGLYPIHYNCRKKPFDDVAFRRALAYCIPKKRIVEEFYEGYGVVAHSTIGSMNKYWHNPDVEKIDLDMDKARKILKDAGYEWDSAGKLYYPAKKN